MAGFKVSMTGALIGAIVAEFASATEGVGILMQRFSFQLDIASSIATLLSMSIMGLILFTLMEVLDSTFVYWKRDSRLRAVSNKRARRFRTA
jgi:NitT/TauT family transport system permease protein